MGRTIPEQVGGSVLRVAASCAAAVFLITGCGQEARIAALEAKIAALDEMNEAIRKDINELRAAEAVNSITQDWDKVAYLTPGSNGYSLVKADFGYITVGLEDIQAYANGSKVKLKFGNLTSARIDGLKATIKWGAVNKEKGGGAKLDEARSRAVQFTESLRAGGWTSVTLVLEGVPPSDFGFVHVSDVSHRGISLVRN